MNDLLCSIAANYVILTNPIKIQKSWTTSVYATEYKPPMSV